MESRIYVGLSPMAEEMIYEFTDERIIEFADTDMAGIVHFSAFFRFMEATEHAFFRSLGLSVHHKEGGHTSGWVRAHADCDYMAPITYQDRVAIRLIVRKKGTTSMGYEFQFRRVAPAPEQFVARGHLTVVHVGHDVGDENIRTVPIPSEFAARVCVAPEDLD